MKFVHINLKSFNIYLMALQNWGDLVVIVIIFYN